jgi:hypothetical protein
LRAPAEAYDQIGPSRSKTEPLSELRAYNWNLNRLIDESGAHIECSRGQGEVLVSATDLEPICRIGAVSDKDRHASR